MNTKDMIQELEERKNRLESAINNINSAIESLEQLESRVLYADRESDKPKINKLLGTKQRDKIRDKLSKQAAKEEKAEKAEKAKRTDRRSISKYPFEMAEFIRENMDGIKNKELCNLVNEKFKVGITPTRLASYMAYNNLRRAPIKITKVNHKPKRSGSGKILKSRKKMFSEDINYYIKMNWQGKKDSELRTLIGGKFGKYYDIDQIKAHRRSLGLVRIKTTADPDESESDDNLDVDEIEDDLEE